MIIEVDIETAIKVVRETLNQYERDAPVCWVETITHVDLVANTAITGGDSRPVRGFVGNSVSEDR